MSDSSDNPEQIPVQAPLTRRVVLKAGSGLLLTALLPIYGCGSGGGGSVTGSSLEFGSPATPQPSFLTEAEQTALRALVDRLIPQDTDPGAVAGACHEAIDALLAAFMTDPPFIYAGGPFSDRGGEPDNDFLEFVELDEYEAFAWRLAIEGSQGIPEREFNGPVKGMQQIYREGLARLDERAQQLGFDSFADMPGLTRDVIINDGNDAVVQELVDIAFPDTLDAMYGPPEYGGNRDLVGWGFTAFDGDTQPRGYTDDQVINPDNPSPLDFLLPPSYSEQRNTSLRAAAPSQQSDSAQQAVAALPALVLSSDEMAQIMMGADGSLARLRERMRPLAEAAAGLGFDQEA